MNRFAAGTIHNLVVGKNQGGEPQKNGKFSKDPVIAARRSEVADLELGPHWLEFKAPWCSERELIQDRPLFRPHPHPVPQRTNLPQQNPKSPAQDPKPQRVRPVRTIKSSESMKQISSKPMAGTSISP